MKPCILILIVMVILVLPGIGYVANIVKLCKCDFETPFKAEVIRGIGVFVFPVGVITGYLTIKDGKETKND